VDTDRTWSRPPVADSLLTRMTADQSAIESAMRPVTFPDGGSRPVLDCGTGAPIICVPMVAELNFVYAAQIELLQRHYRTIVYEPALSTTARVSIADRAAEMRGLLAALGLPRAHFLVWGDTGSAVYLLARESPELCTSIVFVGLADRYTFPFPYGVLLKLLERLPLEKVISSRMFGTVLARFVAGTQIRPEWIVEKGAKIPHLTALFKYSIIPNLFEHRPMPGEVNVPSLLIAGDDDRIVSAPQARRMAAMLPAAAPVVIRPGGQHFVNYVEDFAVNELITDFLATV
jgi:pimeloyl-ACP methyl ester carboxylesterase